MGPCRWVRLLSSNVAISGQGECAFRHDVSARSEADMWTKGYASEGFLIQFFRIQLMGIVQVAL